MIETKRFENIDVLSKYQRVVDRVKTVRFTGMVHRVVGNMIESNGPDVALGDICRIRLGSGNYLYCEVTGFRQDKVIMMPLGELRGITPGAMVSTTGQSLHVAVGEALLGRVIDGVGNPLDGRGQIFVDEEMPVDRAPINPLDRKPIREQLGTGIKAIDGLLSVGKGQRIGIFSGSGVGKSILLGMIARYTSADVNVIAMIGERGREVKEFLENILGEDGLKKSVVIAATSNQPAMVRIRGAYVAATVAEYFRDQGLHVNLLMDSVTRFAQGQREVGLASGEPSAVRGYSTSVFSQLPRLLERSGQTYKGSITGFYTVLVDADDMNEPISDAVRGILDGHIVLSRKLAERNHYPAIDVLASISRCMPDVIDKEHKKIAGKFKAMMAIYKENEDMVLMGVYQAGTNPDLDEALSYIKKMNEFLRQDVSEQVNPAEVRDALRKLIQGEDERIKPAPDTLEALGI
jgi:flagellum-specific ATP synthase